MKTTAETPQELYEQLQRQYPFPFSPKAMRVAVNNEFCEWDRPLQENDTVVFIPPVCGG